MMYIITGADDNSIFAIADMVNEDEHFFIIGVNSFFKKCFNLWGPVEVPSDICISRHCYTEKEGFYENPNWIEPDDSNIYDVLDDVYHKIIDDYTNLLIEEGVIS